jgi:hypothetical protein
MYTNYTCKVYHKIRVPEMRNHSNFVYHIVILHRHLSRKFFCPPEYTSRNKIKKIK